MVYVKELMHLQNTTILCKVIFHYLSSNALCAWQYILMMIWNVGCWLYHWVKCFHVYKNQMMTLSVKIHISDICIVFADKGKMYGDLIRQVHVDWMYQRLSKCNQACGSVYLGISILSFTRQFKQLFNLEWMWAL